MISLFSLASIFLAGILNISLGLIVLLRNPKGPLNRTFFALCLGMILWTSTSIISDSTDNYNLSRLTSSLAFGFGFLSMTYLYLFCLALNQGSFTKLRVSIHATVSVFLTAIFSTHLVYDLTSLDSFNAGILYWPYIITLLIILFLSLKLLYTSYQKGTAAKRNQVVLIVFGVAVTVIGGIIFNTILPLFNSDFSLQFTKIGPLFSTFFIVVVGYSIVKHRLFDLRTALARAVGYALVTAFIVIVYVTTAFFVKRLLLPDLQVTTNQLISNIILAIILVTTFPRIKGKFDKITNTLFFRDAYDTQAMIDQLNQTLVSNVEIESLLTKCALIIQENIKTSFCTFFIGGTSYFEDRIIGAHRDENDFKNIEKYHSLSSKLKSKVFSVESIPGDSNESKLAEILKTDGVEVLVRLVNTLEYQVKGMGYILIGPKKSGSLYSVKDIKILEIIGNELVIATENILRFEEIEQFNVTLQKKIDEATKELKNSNEKLRALDEAKDEFVSMASHQLRTPLTSIKGYISMVLEGDAGAVNDVQKQMLGQAYFSSQRMVYLISDLLNVSRLKTGKFNIEAKPVYLPSLVQSEIEQLIEGARSKNITLAFRKPDKFSTLSLDEMKVRQVVMNFTDNAIYYTPAGGKIDIQLKESAKTVEFTVKDTGIGVPKEQQHKLFVKFFRADNARKTRPDGTGLGLFMAKKVIIAQGGAMIFESKEGKGSTFGFSFPKEKLEVDSKTEDQQPKQKQD